MFLSSNFGRAASLHAASHALVSILDLGEVGSENPPYQGLNLKNTFPAEGSLAGSASFHPLRGGRFLLPNKFCRRIEPGQSLAWAHALKLRMSVIILGPRPADRLQGLFLNFIFHFF